MGGDYLVASAYTSRGEGAVRDIDGQSYSTPPARYAPTYRRYYPRHVEWFVAGADFSGAEAIKQAIMAHGAIGTCMYWGSGFYQSAVNSHYQPPTDSRDPNHSIAIAGWDDNRATQAPSPGAWLCKNSWGTSYHDAGYFWISYYDKHCCRHPEMGAVSFRDVTPFAYSNVYYHDYHGWRDTFETNSAFNAFSAVTNELLTAVSFFTATNNAAFTVSVYRRFAAGSLSGLRSTQSGAFAHPGLHTVDLDVPVVLRAGDAFYIRLDLSAGGQPFDRTSTVDVLLERPGPNLPYDGEFFRDMGKMARTRGTTVVSAASGGESYYWDGAVWQDLTNLNETANFCIKGLTLTGEFEERHGGMLLMVR